MILSDSGIKKFIKSGDIFVDPFEEKLLKPGSLTLTLDSKLFIPEKKDLLDLSTDKAEYRNIKIDEKGYIIKPGQFLLARTKEKVGLSTKLGCILDARTTLARIGLNFLQCSMFIQPGQNPIHQTLEVKLIGNTPVKIYPGMKVIKAIFFQLSSQSEKSYGKEGTYGKSSGIKVMN